MYGYSICISRPTCQDLLSSDDGMTLLEMRRPHGAPTPFNSRVLCSKLSAMPCSDRVLAVRTVSNDHTRTHSFECLQITDWRSLTGQHSNFRTQPNAVARAAIDTNALLDKYRREAGRSRCARRVFAPVFRLCLDRPKTARRVRQQIGAAFIH